MRMALVLGSAVEFAGAMSMGALVSKTISKGMIDVDAYSAQVPSQAHSPRASLW